MFDDSNSEVKNITHLINESVMKEAFGSTSVHSTFGQRSCDEFCLMEEQSHGLFEKCTNTVCPQATQSHIGPPKERFLFGGTKHIVEKDAPARPINSELDYMYLQNLKSRAVMLSTYLNSNDKYKGWIKNWRLLQRNLERNGYKFERLGTEEDDVAHVIDKGSNVRFRIRESSGKYIPINIYQYVMAHELAHMATKDTQHSPEFWRLLSIMSFALFELGLIDFSKLRKFNGYYNSNGQPILSIDSIKSDIRKGIKELKDVNGDKNEQYSLYEELLRDS